MLRRNFGSCFVVYAVAVSFVSLTSAQRWTRLSRENLNQGQVCNEEIMKKALLQTKPWIKPLMDQFTTRSILIEIYNRSCIAFIGNLKVNSYGIKNSGHDEFVRMEDLENLRQLKYIYGNVELELSQYADVKNLSFFANMVYISGVNENSTFSIWNSQISSLFPPKFWMDSPIIEIVNNKNLCYLENFPYISTGRVINGNKSPANCKLDGAVCYSGCNGCVGPGKDLCQSCKSKYWMQLGSIPSQYTCTKCDPICEFCSGPGRNSSNCSCKYKSFYEMCVFTCPNGTYESSKYCINCTSPIGNRPIYNFTTASGFRTCKYCDIACSTGCSGITNKDCFQCEKYKHFYNKTSKDQFECLLSCPLDDTPVKDVTTGKFVCGTNEANGTKIMSFNVISLCFIASKLIFW